MIVSSFAQQYGIRLEREKHTIKCSEYRRLLSGINGDTPLGYVVQTRAETDSKKIQEMTNHQKQIRADWREFKNKQKQKQNKSQRIVLSNDQINEVMKKLFG